MLWIGGSLPELTILCIESFRRHGHPVHLYHYDPIPNAPEGTELLPATSILSRDAVFRYESGWEHAGSYAGFSDIFRFKLLFDKGGWYVDADVMCLRPLDFAESYVFRTNQEQLVVGNIMKCPAGSSFARDCYEETRSRVNASNRDWALPIRILSDHVVGHGLQEYIRCDIANSDSLSEIAGLVFGTQRPIEGWYVIHWCNEYWRMFGWSQDRVAGPGTYATLTRELRGIEDAPTRSLIAVIRDEIAYQRNFARSLYAMAIRPIIGPLLRRIMGRPTRPKGQLPAIKILMPHFGPWPESMRRFFQDCSANPQNTWLVFADHPLPVAVPPNVVWRPMTLQAFNRLASHKLGFPVSIGGDKDLSDLRPALGTIFEDYLSFADFFGWRDEGEQVLFRNTALARSRWRLSRSVRRLTHTPTD